MAKKKRLTRYTTSLMLGDSPNIHLPYTNLNIKSRFVCIFHTEFREVTLASSNSYGVGLPSKGERDSRYSDSDSQSQQCQVMLRYVKLQN